MGEVDADEPTLYEILGVDELVSQDALTKAYRQRALEEHPDKGGDADHFDDLVKAFKTLSVQASREAYDEKLAKARERSKLVIGHSPAGVVSKKQAEAPMREKTAPHAGSTRQGKMRTFEPGKLGHCANEWKGMGSAHSFLKMITDDVTPQQQTERLFDQYAKLPPGKEKKREWTNSLRGPEKADLKALAKKKEAEKRAKMQVWLNHGPCGDGKARRDMKKAASKKATATKSEPSSSAIAEEVGEDARKEIAQAGVEADVSVEPVQ